MRIRLSGLIICALAIVVPSIARAQKLNDDDRKFLQLVEPIILDDEERTYKKLKDKDDRIEFQKIFWARRDPDPKTPQNAFRDQYLKDRAIAETRFAIPADVRPGWANHCGRVFILLGEPDHVEQDAGWDMMGAGKRRPETWTYRDKPERKVTGGKAEISFNDSCWGSDNLESLLDRVAALKVVQPNLDYRIDKKGHLVKLVDLLPQDSAGRALVEQPRQDFPLAAQAAYLKIADGGTGLFGLVRGDAATLTSTDTGGTKTVSITVAAKAVAEDGSEAGWIEQALKAPVGADGAFLASFKMALKPGRYTMSIGALEAKSGKGSLASVPVEVPDFSKVEAAADGATHSVPSISSLVLVRSFEELPAGAPADPADPFSAFTLGNLRMVPHFGATFRSSDEVSVLYQVYDLAMAKAPTNDPAAKPAGKAQTGSANPEGRQDPRW